MDFNQFQIEFIQQLNSKDRKCLETIEKNKELIQEYLGGGTNTQSETLKNFVKEINNILLDSGTLINIIVEENKGLVPFLSKYDLLEKVLKREEFSIVLDTFRNSDVLVMACKEGKTNVVKWLLTMDVNPNVQDEDGRSALMYAAEQNLNFVISKYFYDEQCINLVDRNGENVLFYCMRNPRFLKDDILTNNEFQTELIYNSLININQTNQNGESILIYCIKNNIIEPISKFLLHNTKIDVNIADNNGKTAAMYLTEKGLCTELLELHRKSCNYEYTDMEGNSAMTILLDKLYSENDPIQFYNYVRIMSVFVNYQLDFNYGLDLDENTAFMIILVVNDKTTAKFCARYLKKLDLSVRNKYGEDATSLCFKLNHYELMPYLKNNPTFNYHYRDPLNQNTLLMISAINNPEEMKELLENDPSIINEVNLNQENSLIIASKINQEAAVDILLKQGINIHQQDHLGNTALHYAVEIGSASLVYKLMKKGADPHLKNLEGISALDIAQARSEERKDILELLTQPASNLNYLKKPEGSSEEEIRDLYTEEVQKYLLPYANNNHPDYVFSKKKERIMQEVYQRNKGIGYMPFSQMIRKGLPTVGVYFIIIMFFIIIRLL